ncbi:MAG: MerR family transcriptional regulator, partial [Eubacteriales bacterium]|nr:MerR family transcriptional regulator [Eubacteriales bacterium]
MSKYTTGEIAKICEVTVRTVQYYDSRGILTPSELSDGGRRLYTDDDLKKLKIICFLRDMGLPINSISKMLCDSESKATVEVLLQQHEQEVKAEYEQCSKKLDVVRGLLNELKQTDDFTVNTLGDVAQIMKNKDKRKKVMRNIILSALGLEACEILTGVLWGITGIWWPFAAVTVVTLITV